MKTPEFVPPRALRRSSSEIQRHAARLPIAGEAGSGIVLQADRKFHAITASSIHAFLCDGNSGYSFSLQSGHSPCENSAAVRSEM